jgi:hypothetical protein
MRIISTRENEPLIPPNVLGESPDLLGDAGGIVYPQNPPAPMEWIAHEILQWDKGNYGDNYGALRPQKLSSRGRLINFILLPPIITYNSSHFQPVATFNRWLNPSVGQIIEGGSSVVAKEPGFVNGLYYWMIGYLGVQSDCRPIMLPESDEYDLYGSILTINIAQVTSQALTAAFAYGWMHRG